MRGCAACLLTAVLVRGQDGISWKRSARRDIPSPVCRGCSAAGGRPLLAAGYWLSELGTLVADMDVHARGMLRH
jgi:hypothetical protein